MIVKSAWYIVKGVKKTFSLVVYKWFHQMNTEVSWVERNDRFFPVTPLVNLLFSFLSPHLHSSFKRTKARGALDRSNTWFLYCHHSEREPGLELLVISWQRTPSPGLTVKGGSAVLSALLSAAVPEWGKGFQAAWCAVTGCCHLLAQG